MPLIQSTNGQTRQIKVILLVLENEFIRPRYRSSRPEVFCKKGVRRSLTKFTEKHMCKSVFFNKDAGTACNLIKK